MVIYGKAEVDEWYYISKNTECRLLQYLLRCEAERKARERERIAKERDEQDNLRQQQGLPPIKILPHSFFDKLGEDHRNFYWKLNDDGEIQEAPTRTAVSERNCDMVLTFRSRERISSYLTLILYCSDPTPVATILRGASASLPEEACCLEIVTKLNGPKPWSFSTDFLLEIGGNHVTQYIFRQCFLNSKDLVAIHPAATSVKFHDCDITERVVFPPNFKLQTTKELELRRLEDTSKTYFRAFLQVLNSDENWRLDTLLTVSSYVLRHSAPNSPFDLSHVKHFEFWDLREVDTLTHIIQVGLGPKSVHVAPYGMMSESTIRFLRAIGSLDCHLEEVKIKWTSSSSSTMATDSMATTPALLDAFNNKNCKLKKFCVYSEFDRLEDFCDWDVVVPALARTPTLRYLGVDRTVSSTLDGGLQIQLGTGPAIYATPL